MDSVVKKISKKYPCRQKVIKELYQLIGNAEDAHPNAIYFYGHTGTGKSAIMKELLKLTENKSVILNCVENYTNKILFENIINTFRNHKIKRKNNFTSFAKCENAKEFLQELSELNEDASYVICLENAERLRDMENNILPMLLRLPELTGLNICVILVSQIPFEKYFLKSGLPDIITVYCPQFSKNELEAILLRDFSNVKEYLNCKLMKFQNDDYEVKKEILQSIELPFYENYLNIFLKVFCISCRDLPELQLISRECFEIYCEPVLNQTIDQNDLPKLWRHIAGPLKAKLSIVYMRIEYNSEKQIKDTTDGDRGIKTLARSLELPYYAKYLLIAAFLASYNTAKEDKRLFMKNHGKKKKRMQTVNANAKITDKMSTSLGPKSFTIDRLLAIFYAIVEDKVGLNCNLLAQISSLVHLKFLSFVSGENNIMDGSARIQCTVSLDFILHLGKIVGFNVRQYLCDFM